MQFLPLGYVPDHSINFVTIIGRHEGRWLIIRTNDAEEWHFPNGKRKNNESLQKTVLREVQERRFATVMRMIPLGSYSCEYGAEPAFAMIYYCDYQDINNATNACEVVETATVIDPLDVISNCEHREIYSYVLRHRKVVNDWFWSDTRSLMGRTSSIYINDECFEIKKNVADPMSITKTMQGFFSNQSLMRLTGPIQLDINPTSKCTDKCVFCFNKNDRKSDSGQFNPSKVIDAISYLIDNSGLMHLKSSGFGDPLLCPDIWDVFKYGRKQGLISSLNTNGFNLGKYVDEILRNIDSIRFSLDAWGESQFQEIHGVRGFENRIRDIETLTMRRVHEQPELIIGIHFVVLPTNRISLRPVVEWAKRIGVDYVDITLDKFIPEFLDKWEDTLMKDVLDECDRLTKYISPKFNVILPSEITASRDGLSKFRMDRINTKKCWQIALRHFITPNGEYGACNAFESQPIAKLTFGNINIDRMCDVFQRIKQEEDKCKAEGGCNYCVIPHGIFNDLCGLLKNAVDNKHVVSHPLDDTNLGGRNVSADEDLLAKAA